VACPPRSAWRKQAGLTQRVLRRLGAECQAQRAGGELRSNFQRNENLRVSTLQEFEPANDGKVGAG